MSQADDFLSKIAQSEEANLAASSIADIGQESSESNESISELLSRVQDLVMPVWPLRDYVAVNPYAGLADRKFTSARRLLRAVSDCELLMPLGYYRERYLQGKLLMPHIQQAISELNDSHEPLPEQMDAPSIINWLVQGSLEINPTKSERQIRTVSEAIDVTSGTDWTVVLRDEVGKFCAMHYDEGQAQWKSPWRELPLYQAWRSAAELDRRVEIMGITGMRTFVKGLPYSEEAALVHLLQQLRVPAAMWEPLLLSMIYTVPGWFAWTRYQANERGEKHVGRNDFVGLLAIRLAYEVALANANDFSIDWSGYEQNTRKRSTSFAISPEKDQEALVRHVLLRASEIAYREQLISELQPNVSSLGMQASEVEDEPIQKLAQMVFCIDVRSERLRRNLERTNPLIETLGFAGFFGLSMEYVPLGETEGTSQVPVLLKPQIQIREGICDHDSCCSANNITTKKAIEERNFVRSLRSMWKTFQSSAATCFTYVETSGLLYAAKLLRRNLGLFPNAHDVARFDGVEAPSQSMLGPTFQHLHEQGIDEARQVEIAESILRNMGLTSNFAKIVVICGHGSETENNPLRAGLDCGACGGHSGEANARFAAKLFNSSVVRQGLLQKGIQIPECTWFVAALHNTTTDEISYFDLHAMPESARGDFESLQRSCGIATLENRWERLPTLGSDSVQDVKRRSLDWSEVRPEWGLAGNAAFIVAPRELTKSLKLDGRTFMHSYNWKQDAEFKTLELIMTAPMVVTNWINLQYYASTVDNNHFGSGSKTIHNVVGKFGILSGNRGDLMTGLPWQSLHDGKDYQHEPLRLQVIIAAPREAITSVIGRHANVENLVCNGWLHLVAIDEGKFYRFTSDSNWQPLDNAV